MGFAISQDETPHISAIPRTLEYLCIYFHEWAYMESQRQAETRRAFKRRVYDTLRIVYCGIKTMGGAHHAASASH
jgi:hypothetical protein